MKAVRIPIDWNPDLSVYASEPFLKSVSHDYGWIGGFDDGGTLRCILPYTVVKKAILRMVRFRVETIPLGAKLNLQEEKAFLNNAIAYLRTLGADMVIPASTNTLFRAYPDGAIAAPYGSYIIDLTHDEENLWSSVSASHRRKVRLAKKAGVRIRNGFEHIETVYKLVRDTFARSALPFMGYEEFRRLVFGLGEHLRLLVAEHNGQVHGCAVIPFSRHSAYYVYGGSIPEPETGAMHLLHWEAIRSFREINVKRYDFVGARIDPDKGSKAAGILTFKERFGGRLEQGYMWKFCFHRMKFLLYSVAARLRTGGDIVDYERHKLRHNQIVEQNGEPQ